MLTNEGRKQIFRRELRLSVAKRYSAAYKIDPPPKPDGLTLGEWIQKGTEWRRKHGLPCDPKEAPPVVQRKKPPFDGTML